MNNFRVDKKITIKVFWIIISSIIIGGVISCGIELFDYIKARETRGEIAINNTWINFNDKVKEESGEYVVFKEGGKVILEFPEEKYINRLQYKYKTAESQKKDCKVTIYTKNVYKENSKEQTRDNYFLGASRSVITIDRKVDKIVFYYPKLNAQLMLSEFVIDNTFKWNPLIAFVISVFSLVLIFLIVFKRENAKHIERMTFTCVLLLSICMLSLQPPYCSAWDEEIHFSKAYNMAITNDDSGAPNTLNYLMDNYAWLNFHHENSMEERIDMIRIMNALWEENDGRIETYDFELSSIGYIFQAVAITIGKLLKLPFYFVWILGKISNLLLYAIGMSIAVWIVPIGKRILSVIALLPTMIFLSTAYTYDIMVIVCITIGICIWIKEMVNKDEKFSWGWRSAYIICMILGCIPKAVYIPLLLCGLFIPANKFCSRKDRYIFNGIVIICFVLIMSTFVLPALFNPMGRTDTRGGETSVSEQLKNIFSMPVAYAVVLWNNVRRTFIDYTIGSALGKFAYWGGVFNSTLYSILIFGTVISDTYEEKRNIQFNIKAKIVSLVSVLGTIVLIWTALYLSFTEVGEVEIAGVQGRYYLPFVFLIYLCVRSNKIKNNIKIENYQMLVMIISSLMLMHNMSKAFLFGIY